MSPRRPPWQASASVTRGAAPGNATCQIGRWTPRAFLILLDDLVEVKHLRSAEVVAISAGPAFFYTRELVPRGGPRLAMTDEAWLASTHANRADGGFQRWGHRNPDHNHGA
jgi:hypothetical protein